MLIGNLRRIVSTGVFVMRPTFWWTFLRLSIIGQLLAVAWWIGFQTRWASRVIRTPRPLTITSKWNWTLQTRLIWTPCNDDVDIDWRIEKKTEMEKRKEKWNRNGKEKNWKRKCVEYLRNCCLFRCWCVLDELVNGPSEAIRRLHCRCMTDTVDRHQSRIQHLGCCRRMCRWHYNHRYVHQIIFFKKNK